MSHKGHTSDMHSIYKTTEPLTLLLQLPCSFHIQKYLIKIPFAKSCILQRNGTIHYCSAVQVFGSPQTFFRPIPRFSVLLAVGTIACRPCAIVHYHSRVSKVFSALSCTCCFYHLGSNSKLHIINNDIYL